MQKLLNQNDFDLLAKIVREETGNQITEKNLPMLESRMRSHLSMLGLNTMEQYWLFYRDNEVQERSLLRGLMTTHYTFFFREFAHFEALGAWVIEHAERLRERHARTGRGLRVWSAACSRGQEPYSLAMYLNKYLLKANNIPFEIVASDIDGESVSFAANGVYPIKEVNTIPAEYLNGNWKKGTGQIKDFAAVHPNLKKFIKFQTFNLLEAPTQLISDGPFDIIFCRNVFIYFSEDNVKKIALNLAGALENEGLLMSGVSEPLRFEEFPLVTVAPTTYSKSAKKQIRTDVPKSPADVVTDSPAEKTKKYKVLCVDDSTVIHTLLKKIFAQDPLCEGLDIAINGQEAWEKINKNKYDLITLDIHMPVMTGIEFLEKHYRKRIDPPVIMVSSVNRADMDLAVRAIELGAFDYVEKPAMNNLQKSIEEVLTKVKMAMRSSQAAEVHPVVDYNREISQKIIIPDASQCLRIVLADSNALDKLKVVVTGQKCEARSPALVIVHNDAEASNSLEKKVLEWTDHPLVQMKVVPPICKPNSIYICPSSLWADLLGKISNRRVSLQIVTAADDLWALASQYKGNGQIIVDEALNEKALSFQKSGQIRVSDITPATSFQSLSVEYFANVRKAAA